MSLTRPLGSQLGPNFWKWTGALLLGFLAGMLTVLVDNKTWPGFYALIRGGAIDMIPTAAALKMTLTPPAGGATGGR